MNRLSGSMREDGDSWIPYGCPPVLVVLTSLSLNVWLMADKFWISCMWAARDCCVTGSIVGLRGGGGAWFRWLAIWAQQQVECLDLLLTWCLPSDCWRKVFQIGIVNQCMVRWTQKDKTIWTSNLRQILIPRFTKASMKQEFGCLTSNTAYLASI
jgi:hypothetical protein